MKSGEQSVAGTQADKMVCDEMPPNTQIRKVISYYNNNDMLVGLIFYDQQGNQIYKSKYSTGFGSDRKKLEFTLAEN